MASSACAQSRLEGFANRRVDQDLGALKELLAVTRKPAGPGLVVIWRQLPRASRCT